MGLNQDLQPGPERRIPEAYHVKKSLTPRTTGPLERLSEENLFPSVSRLHNTPDDFVCPGSPWQVSEPSLVFMLGLIGTRGAFIAELD